MASARDALPPDGTSRPGGRSGRVLAAIHAAVGELVGEGAERITFPLIAQRAGVTPTTIYRRWADVNALLEEVAVAALTRDGQAVPDTGSLQGDLDAWATAVLEDITRPERARFLRAMVSTRTDVLARCPVTERRRDQALEVLRRASARGEAAPSAEQVLDHLIAPLYYYATFALPLDLEHARRLVRDVLAMVR